MTNDIGLTVILKVGLLLNRDKAVSMFTQMYSRSGTSVSLSSHNTLLGNSVRLVPHAQHGALVFPPARNAFDRLLPAFHWGRYQSGQPTLFSGDTPWLCCSVLTRGSCCSIADILDRLVPSESQFRAQNLEPRLFTTGAIAAATAAIKPVAAILAPAAPWKASHAFGLAWAAVVKCLHTQIYRNPSF